MQNWIEGFQESIDFMEEHLTDELDIEEIAGKAALSPFYYQRIFGALCNLTVGEYIRARRMTLAAQELARSDVKVIDVAVRYGYDSPDSFAALPRHNAFPGERARRIPPVPRSAAYQNNAGGWKYAGLPYCGKGSVYDFRSKETVQL